MEEMRIQKYVSDCGLMSRRAAEKEIEAIKVMMAAPKEKAAA